MGKTRKIPVIKNRVVVRPAKKNPTWSHARLVVLAFILMLFFVWIRVQSNLKLSDIQKLEKNLDRCLAENKKLQAEQSRLSSYRRIHKIAVRMGMIVPPKEKIIELSQN